MNIEATPFGVTAAGQPVTKFVLTNSAGYQVAVMNWGATLLEVQVPDRHGRTANVNLCFDRLQPYLDGHPYYGATVGRYCNRIGGAQFSIDGHPYRLTANLGPHHIHGGHQNFTYQYWEGSAIDSDHSVGVRFQLVSPDGQEGYPGTVTARTEYRWNDANELTIEFAAQSDAPTHVSLCNHSYWNLAGAGSGNVYDQVAMLAADQYLEVDEGLIPTGRFLDVAGTPLDFRDATPIGARIDQLPATKGYDHCYVVRGEAGQLRLAARVFDPLSGRSLEVETTQPGMQLYTAGNLGGDERSGGYGPHEAFCLETQRFPNSPNRDFRPTTLLRPGETFREQTVHRFGSVA